MDEPVPRRPLGRSLKEASKAMGCVALVFGLFFGVVGYPIYTHVNLVKKRARAQNDLWGLAEALQRHAQRTGRLPTEAEGLRELVTTGALERLPKDPWGYDYGYSLQDEKARVWSLGADGVPGGEGDDGDLEQEVHPKSPPR